MDKPDFAEMKSRPTFEVDIIRNGKTLSFTCSFMQEPDATGGSLQTDAYSKCVFLLLILYYIKIIIFYKYPSRSLLLYITPSLIILISNVTSF